MLRGAVSNGVVFVPFPRDDNFRQSEDMPHTFNKYIRCCMCGPLDRIRNAVMVSGDGITIYDNDIIEWVSIRSDGIFRVDENGNCVECYTTPDVSEDYAEYIRKCVLSGNKVECEVVKLNILESQGTDHVGTHVVLVEANGYVYYAYYRDYNVLAFSSSSVDDYNPNVVNLVSALSKVLRCKRVDDMNLECTVGMDTEFELVSGSRIVVAYDIIRDERKKAIIGTDGAGSQMEIRPCPSNNPAKVVSNLMKNILVAENTTRCLLSVSGHKYPIGCHIHIGLGFEPKDAYCRSIVSFYDEFFGKQLIDLSGEARRSYKQLNSFRVQPHGLEYRTLPAAVTENPHLTYLVLKGMKNLTDSLFKNEWVDILTSGQFPYVRHDSYMKYCGFTESDYDNFVLHAARLRSEIRSSRVLVARWTRRSATVASQAYVPSITFQDEWGGLKPIFADILKASMLKILEMHDDIRLFPNEILLYGLHKKHGNAVRTNIGEIENIIEYVKKHIYHNLMHKCKILISDNAENSGARRVAVGLPYSFRNSKCVSSSEMAMYVFLTIMLSSSYLCKLIEGTIEPDGTFDSSIMDDILKVVNNKSEEIMLQHSQRINSSSNEDIILADNHESNA